MTADQIAAALRGNPTVAEASALINACTARRSAIDARFGAIRSASHPFPDPPERAAAIRSGAEAVARLDAELEALSREHDYLDKLEAAATEHLEARKASDIRAAAPKARKELPRSMGRVRKALAELDAAIAALGATTAPLFELAALAGERFPLTDDEAGELLELRNEVWKLRTVATTNPAAAEPQRFARCFRAAYEVRGGDEGQRILPRQPPQQVWLPDIGEPYTAPMRLAR